MPTEVWFHNPGAYIREIIECGQDKLTWHIGTASQFGADFLKYTKLYYVGKPFRMLVIGSQGAAEYTQESPSLEEPVAVYPVWEYGQPIEVLEELMEMPVGEDVEICSNQKVRRRERPVFGQEHRVVVTGIPNTNSGPGRQAITALRDLVQGYPECILHIHGSYSFRIAFGMDWPAADFDCRIPSKGGSILIPSGSKVSYKEAVKYSQWVHMLGYTIGELNVPRNRCTFNIRSCVWAGKYYTSNIKFIANRTKAQGIDIPDSQFKPPQRKAYLTTASKVGEGDKLLCNLCSLQFKCKFYRDEAVCSVPDSEPRSLGEFFQTRDASLIIDGLGTLLAANTRRLEKGIHQEEVEGGIDKNVTALVDQVFRQATTLAKLVDPSLRGGAKVNVNVGTAGETVKVIEESTPRQLVASIVRELERRGFKREEITPEMIETMLRGMADPEMARKVITASGEEVGGVF